MTGIPVAIPGQNSQVALGADDVMILCVETVKTSKKANKWWKNIYAKASGGRVNWEKSVGILIGKCKRRRRC